jgi:putative transposase
MVDKLVAEHGLNRSEAFHAIGLSRSSYYYRSKSSHRKRSFDPALCAAIQAIHKRASVYGYRKVCATLHASGWRVNHKRVLRYMRHLGLLQPRKTKGETFSTVTLVKPECSNIYWEEDLTYVWCGDQQGYLFALIDGYDKEIPGEYFGDRCRADEAAAVLEQAVLKRFGGRVPEGHRLVLRIDRGTQFRARKFRETAKRLGVELEYAGIRCPDDKPYIEAFFSKYKTEEVYRNDYRNIGEAKEGWQYYRMWHETERVHQSLGYKTPKDVYEDSQKNDLDNAEKICDNYETLKCPK